MGIQYFEWWCPRSRYPPRLKYWMPIHYDTIEGGQNKKKSHLLFSFLVRYRIVLFCISMAGFVKNNYYIISLTSLHLNNYTPYENKCFNPRNRNHRVAFATCVNFSVNCWTREPSRSSNGWAEFLPEPMKFLADMLNHAYWLRIDFNRFEKFRNLKLKTIAFFFFFFFYIYTHTFASSPPVPSWITAHTRTTTYDRVTGYSHAQ